MFEWKRLLSWHNWNKFFWILFIVMGAVLIIGAAAGVLSLVEILLAFIIIAIGAEKLGEEISDKMLQDEQGKINRDLIFISRWLENNNIFTRQLKDKHEMRILKLDNKRVEIEKKHELSYRELAGKIFEIENRLNEVSRALIQEIKDMNRDRKVDIRRLDDKMERLRSGVLRPVKTIKPVPAVPRTMPRVMPKAMPKAKTKAPAFESAWTHIRSVAGKRKSIPTLSKKANNVIVSVDKDSIRLREGKAKKLVVLKKSEFRQFWNVLARKRVLNFVKDMKGRALIRKGSIIVSFLARLPPVEFTLRPRVLHLMPKNTHKLGTLKRRKW